MRTMKQLGLKGLEWMVKGMAMLPLWMLYRLSDLLYLFLRYVIRYRKTVIFENLSRSFPHKNAEEIRAIAGRFYLHFCDVIVEGLKNFQLSDRALAQRVELMNPEILEEILARGAGGILLASHYGNFEWMCSRIDLLVNRQFPTYAVYTPIRNPEINRMIKQMRERRGLQMLRMRKAMYEALRRLQSLCLFGMIGDQSPHRSGKLFFTPFLNQATAFHTSIAKVSLRAGADLYFADMRKSGRGKYQLWLERIPVKDYLPESETNVLALTEAYVSRLEAVIEAEPAYWLWSHRRWKHQPKEGDKLSAAWTDRR